MKLSNIFKKENKIVAKSNIETLAKGQLAKVIGGGGPDVPVETDSTSGEIKNKGVIKGSIIINNGNA